MNERDQHHGQLEKVLRITIQAHGVHMSLKTLAKSNLEAQSHLKNYITTQDKLIAQQISKFMKLWAKLAKKASKENTWIKQTTNE